MPSTPKIRLQLALARAGLGSRRAVEKFISEGKIRVDGKIARLGQLVDPTTQEISFRGKVLSVEPKKKVVIAVNKPRGVVSTVSDPQGRKTVLDLVSGKYRLFPIGRLDVMSEGLILLTNDGELANRLMHPRYEIPKVYEVKIRGVLDDKKIEFLKKGVRTPEGKVKAAEVLDVQDVTRRGVKKHRVILKVFEGKNHHVRKMFDALKCRVIRLRRISMGPIQLRGIPRGGYRILPPSIVAMLRKETKLT